MFFPWCITSPSSCSVSDHFSTYSIFRYSL
uniref:Uncharacterized protein n=1 Tax=Anguilla anguilla TaxID=7936 RepID=A0A0E9V8U6_ANGAN